MCWGKDMDIVELKQCIEEGNLQVGFLIFKYTDSTFLPLQYINALRSGKDISVLNDLDEVSPQKDIFGETNSNDRIRVFTTDCFESNKRSLLDEKGLIVVCKKITNEEMYKNNTIVFPVLESWQIKDFVYSMAEGVPEEKLDMLIRMCNNDIFRLDTEVSKLKLFTEQERKHVFDDFLNDGVFDDLSDHNIFDFSNALLKRDIPSIASLYKEIDKIDVEPLGLVTTVYNNLRNIISIQFDPSSSPEKLGIPSNRFWAIKKNACGYYTKDQLLMAFYMITDIDRKLKSGEITTDIMIDYIVCHMLSF